MMRSSKQRVSAGADTQRFDDVEAPASGRRRRVFPTDRASDSLARLQLLVRLAVRRVAGARDHEFDDLVQTSLASVLAALGERGVDADYSAPWVISVARNVAIDQLRARTRLLRVFAPVLEEATYPTSWRAPDLDHLLDARDELRRFDLGLRRLGSRQSMVVYLHDVLGYHLAEIARAVGITVAAAQSRLIRGRRAMQKDLSAL